MRFASDGALRVRNLVKDLLDFSLVGRRQLELETVSLITVIREVLDNPSPVLAEL